MNPKDPEDASPGEIWTDGHDIETGALYLVIAPQTEAYRERGEGSPDLLVYDIAGPDNPVGWGDVTSMHPDGLGKPVCELSTFERHAGSLDLTPKAESLLAKHDHDH